MSRKAYTVEIRSHNSYSWSLFLVETNRKEALESAKRYSVSHSWDGVKVTMWENGLNQTVIAEY